MSKAAIKKARAERLNAALDKLAAQFPDGGQLWLSTSPETLFEQAAEEIARLRAERVPAPPPVSEQGAERGELPGFTWESDGRAVHPSGAYVERRDDGRWLWFAVQSFVCLVEDRRDTAVQAAAYALGLALGQHAKGAWWYSEDPALVHRGSFDDADDAALAALQHHAQQRAVPRGAGGGEQKP